MPKPVQICATGELLVRFHQNLCKGGDVLADPDALQCGATSHGAVLFQVAGSRRRPTHAHGQDGYLLSASGDERTAIRQASIPGRDFSWGEASSESALACGSPERELTEPPSRLDLVG